MASTTTSLLHTATVQKLRATANRTHILFHFLLILSVFYYRLFSLLKYSTPDHNFLATPWIFMIIAELILTCSWFFGQSFRWRPVSRSVHPERLPGDQALPGVDVFICTADPKKEPTLEVMNTVISAICLDYPSEKLAVYLSDDSGTAVTLNGMREAAVFARWWIPFCRKYNIKTRCPGAYFSAFSDGNEQDIRGGEFQVEQEKVKLKYEHFKKLVESTGGDVAQADDMNNITGDGRAPLVQVIHDSKGNEDENDVKMPLLVYVSRERRPSYPHRFKAGALNALLRVSGIISNFPYVMVLDCDMYCNDPTSAKQAMCFHLDPNMSTELAFVQYPQAFYNVTKNDIYDGQARSAYKTKWQGMDGLRGPVLTGTGYYLKRKALFGSPNQEDAYLHQPALSFGNSDMFIASLHGNNQKHIFNNGQTTEEQLKEALVLASCKFEKGTKWGSEIGYTYECLLESTFTGYYLQCKGWKSVYCYPKKPAFLGCATIDMKDALVQLRKWNGHLLELGFSKFSPLTYGLSRMPFLHSMCYAYFAFQPLQALSFLIYGIVPQFCFVKGISLFPKVTDPWFAAFAVVWISSSLLQHMYEVLSNGDSLRTWWNEQRIWVIKVVSGSLFGFVDCLMKKIGISKTVFRLTNKAIEKEKLENYEKGKFDLQGAELFMVPLVGLVIWNMACLVGGIWRMFVEGNISEMFGQLFLSSFLLLVSYPIIEGIVTRKGKGKSNK